MSARLAFIVALLCLASASLGFAQSGFVPTGSILVECDVGCRIEMPAFGLVEEAEPRELVSLGGLPADAYEFGITSGSSAWELTLSVCGAATAVTVISGEVTVEPPDCGPFGYVALTLPPGARAEVAANAARVDHSCHLRRCVRRGVDERRR